MHYRSLGRSGIDVSLLGFGTGGPKTFTESELDAAGRTEIVRYCLDQGINLFDTSQGYGESELALGRALRGVPRGSYVLATKWSPRALAEGAELALFDDPEVLRRGVQDSLARLQTDYIDIMFFHGLRPTDYALVYERFGAVMEQMKSAGTIRCIALSERMGEDLTHQVTIQALEQHPEFWDVVMLRYAIFNQSAAQRALPMCAEYGVGVLNMSPVRYYLADPLLLEEQVATWKNGGDIAAAAVPDQDPLGWLVHDEVDSVPSAAIKFAAANAGVSSVLTGTRNRAHLEANIRALERPQLSAADHKRLQTVFGGLLEYR